MLRVTVELLPYGFEENKKKLAEMDIYNDGSGSLTHGNYVVRTYRKGSDRNVVTRKSFVLNHPRLGKHVWVLVHKALSALGYTK